MMEWFQKTQTGFVLSSVSSMAYSTMMGFSTRLGGSSPSLWMAVLTTGVLIIGRFGNLQKEKNHKNDLDVKMESTDLADRRFPVDSTQNTRQMYHQSPTQPSFQGSTFSFILPQCARGVQETAVATVAQMTFVWYKRAVPPLHGRSMWKEICTIHRQAELSPQAPSVRIIVLGQEMS